MAKDDLEEWATDWDDDALETNFDKYLASELQITQQPAAGAAQ